MATAVRTAQTCRNFVNGQWIESCSGKTFERRNPANHDDVVAVVPLSTREEMCEAVAAAKAALPLWRDTPAPERGRILAKAAAQMAEQKNELARILTREEGKTYKESLVEVQRAADIVEFMAGEGRRLAGQTLPSERAKTFAYTIKQPLGVVGAITPWNFPLAIPAWKAAPALVTGNTVILKPAEITPLSAIRMVEIFAQAGLPAGVLNLVLGDGAEIGDEMVQHPDVHAISFTGSNEVGGMIYASGARKMKKCQCEMGGKNAIVVLADADLHLAVESAAAGAFGSSGQRCTATSRVVVEEKVADALVSLLVARAREFRAGDGLEEGTAVGPVVDENQMETVLRYLEIGKKEAKLLLGGNRLAGGAYDRGLFVAPTVFDHVKWDSTIAQEEIFGPVLSVIRVADFDEALRVANSVKYGLSSSVYTNDSAKMLAFIDGIETGLTHVNVPTVWSEAHMPFGGTKCTGVGERELGSVAIDFYTELKTVYIDYGAKKQ
ncbi:MAG TPA: aldehyde dehydrogenase family protein [Candidatus Dormibacteraeota bacterium]|nr:aldehyde dehydrogenase family protein [Candidatus Dormibacteraeota bacterium]